jgi:chemotaxis protein CheD
MNNARISKFGKKVTLIYAGDYYASDVDEIIGTLLGSCISLCLYDSEKRIGGMNHFMLPGKMTSVDINSGDSAKYGISAIHKLIEGMIEKGASRKNMCAKLFGGGAVLDIEDKSTAIPDNNIRLARLLMEVEDIPIVEEDTGGKYIRKVYLDVKTGKAFVRKTLRHSFLDNKEIAEKKGAKKCRKSGCSL